MIKPVTSKKRRPVASQALVTKLDRLATVIEEQTRAIKALVRENQRLVDVLLSDAGVIDDGDQDAEPGTYLDGSRRQ